MRLREWLIEMQKDLGESDAKFAKRLGIGRPHWTFIRRGENRVSLKVAAGAYQAFPQARQAICEMALGQDDAA